MPPIAVNHAWASSLSSVVLLEVPFGYCLQLLQLLPNLIEFRARGRRFHSSDLPALDKELVLPKMEIFEWSFARDESSISLLRYVHLPSLRTLGLGLIGYDEVEPATSGLFLKRLPPTVTELELVWFSADPDQAGVDWEIIFPPLVSVRKLSLIQCSLASTEEILGCLAYKKRWLPALAEICIIDRDPAEMEKYDDTPIPKGDDDYKIEVRKAVLRFAETRRDGLGSGFDVKTIGRRLGWSLRDKKRVDVLISRGLRLGILEDEQLVECLYSNI
ncbi:hypothetical protein P691DRAFT_805121 [Macrolepiota fuliginosa MF-IS2]|uniref:Uncharacterized protein n=1 Tax=Macrolepiota fuliginosa MF-IS2 TaxID=1400762 RepID=A0A9P5XN96_9AGAR|nr:hypothetical protein P691DRAFT_805121 [Macrolepiota fuliginosa MF-IS2]